MKPGWVTANNFQFVNNEDQGWNNLLWTNQHMKSQVNHQWMNYLVKTSNSNIETWLLLVKSIVFCNAVASLIVWIGCIRFNFSLNSSQGTIVLKYSNIKSFSKTIFLGYFIPFIEIAFPELSGFLFGQTKLLAFVNSSVEQRFQFR